MSDDAYEFYPCLVDGAPASIYVNLKYEDARVADADTRYHVAVRLRDAQQYGIGGEEEAAELSTAEEAIIARATSAVLAYVGRVRHGGIWESTFYGPPGREDALRRTVTEVVGDRDFRVVSARDAEWTYYRELLLPDEERRQWMDDRRMVEILREQGDVLRARRRVDHELAFATAAARDAFVEAAARDGFTLERVSERTAGARMFVAQVSRHDPIELDHIHDVVMLLVDAATKRGGVYERWTSSIVGPT